MPDFKSIAVHLYLLSRVDIPNHDEWSKCVVAAEDEKSARELANQESRSEGYIWTDGSLVEAKVLGHADDDVSGIILFSREFGN
jgi:hypothetical protein